MNLFKQFKKSLNIIMISTILLTNMSTISAQLNIGQYIPNINLQNDENESVNLQSLKGKILLVDFWASWCGPCRKANKKLVKLHKDYSDQDFEIVGISLDVDQNKWRKAILSDKLEHLQFIDPKGFDAQSAEIFGLEALPASFLFDREGKLIMINPNEKEIINYLNQIKKQ